MLNVRNILFIMLGAGFLFASCGRDGMKAKEYVLSDDDKGFGSDHALMEFLNEDVENIADMVMYDNTASINGCNPVVTHDTANDKLIIDFGAECEDAAHMIRKGKIIVNYTRQYWDSGSTRTITYDDYYYNGNRLTGYKVVENRGKNPSGYTYFSIIMADTLHLGGNSGTIQWYSERSRIWLNGFNTTSVFSDDDYHIDGSGSLKRANNSYCDFNILSTFLVSTDCKYVKEGVLEIIPRDGYARTIDYGNGECNDDATIEINGKIFDIKL